jgi:peptidoglycan/LPS O-acetylase OafA/YrhL
VAAVATPVGAPAAGINLSGYIPALDGVRGIAIALVLANNLYPGYPDGFVDRLFYTTSNAGWVGVDLFFVLSGFLITGILWDTRHQERYFTTFYARRFLRIFPLYYGFLLLWNVTGPLLLPDPQGIHSWHENQWWYWTYLSNVKEALYGPGPLEPGHFWSLAVEEQFYLIWPLVVLTADRRRLLTICVAMIVTAFALRLGWRLHDPSKAAGNALYVLTPTRMDGLAVGALLAVTARTGPGIAQLARWARPLFPAGLLALLAIFAIRKGFYGHDLVVQTVGYSIVALTAGAGLVLAVAARPGSRRHAFITHPALVALGRYSYGIYVWHFASRLTWGWSFVQKPPKLLGYEFPMATAIWLVLAGFAVLLGMASWHGIERPILRLKERFPYRRPGARLPGTGQARDRA